MSDTQTPAEAGTKAAKRELAAADERSPAQIEAEIVATRERLAGRIDELTAYVAPPAVARRQRERIRAFYVDEFGGIRPERVAATAAVGLALLALWRRRRRARR